MTAPLGSRAWWKRVDELLQQFCAFKLVISKEKKVASSCEITGEFRRPPALIENPALLRHKPDF